MFGLLRGFRCIFGAKSLLNLHNRGPCVESSWRRFENVLAAYLESKRETHIETH